MRTFIKTSIVIGLMVGAWLPADASDDIGLVYQEEDHASMELGPELSTQGFSPKSVRVNDTFGGQPNLFLTFDDGSSRTTPALLDVLDQFPQVRVTFFVNCKEEVTGTFQRILDAGHAIGNHTCNHEYLSRIGTSQRVSQLTRLQSYVDARIRAPLDLGCFRPPFGGTDDSVRADASRVGLQEWTWSIDPRDWERPGVDSILSSLERMDDGDIIVMHDSNGKEQTVEAVRRFLSRHADEYMFRELPGCGKAEPLSWNGVFFDDDLSVFEADVEWLTGAGITRGCSENRFCPDDPVTRGQMSAFLVRAMGLTDDGGGNLFVDDDASVFEADVDRLAAAGITKGCAENRFCPDNPVSRGQMAAFLVRALSLTDDGGGDLFTDDDASVFEADVDRLAAAGITKGCGESRFCPDDPVTRGEMAALLHRALGVPELVADGD